MAIIVAEGAAAAHRDDLGSPDQASTTAVNFSPQLQQQLGLRIKEFFLDPMMGSLN